ncbi:glycosyltransferase family 2 protein [Methylopila turkensis]|uniref:Glycosyl transferase family A n=1 Tax=Methylopila turkensis TaxID=1437816 RepID=A0A9W6JR16_9HYPH|nr:glycosyltransferase [Methylopila turkensis]GLK80033.1 glycosyl transferase family A [Methylopila turkensis]
MTGVSVLTLARGRTEHLRNLVEGLGRSERAPDELVVVDMNDEPLVLEAPNFPLRLVRLPGERLPLAAARNLAARLSTGARLLFLDADCIPSRALLGAVDQVLRERDGVVCPEVLYLGPDDARGDWTERDLVAAGRPHEARRFPESGLRIVSNPGLFWSLAFGVRRETFEALGGFDETFVGYGGEDTDFGFRAETKRVPLLFMGEARAFHQHHPVSDPPFEHLADIVRNAEVFRRKWGRWPMEGWLAAFERAGAIRLGDGTIEIVQEAA